MNATTKKREGQEQAVQAWCETCQDMRAMRELQAQRTNTGKAYRSGKCAVCGAVIYAIPPAEQPR